jgi:hypothetical protein
MKSMIEYYSSVISKEDIDEIRKEFNKIGITLDENDKNGKIFMALQADIVLFLSNEIVKNILLGVAASITYDILKKAILNILNKINQKKIIRIQNSNEYKSMDFELCLEKSNGSKLHFKFSNKTSKHIQEKCISNVSKVIKRENEIVGDKICYYSKTKSKWIVMNKMDYIRKYLIKKNKKKKG